MFKWERVRGQLDVPIHPKKRCGAKPWCSQHKTQNHLLWECKPDIISLGDKQNNMTCIYLQWFITHIIKITNCFLNINIPYIVTDIRLTRLPSFLLLGLGVAYWWLLIWLCIIYNYVYTSVCNTCHINKKITITTTTTCVHSDCMFLFIKEDLDTKWAVIL